MLGFIKRFSRVAAVASLLVAAGSAHALAIQYYTTGAFVNNSNGGSPIITNGASGPFAGPTYTGLSVVQISTSELIYNYSGLVGPVSLPTTLTLGTFQVSTTDTTPVSFDGIGFILDIYQKVPGGGPGILDAVVNGTLSNTFDAGFGSDIPSSTLTISFNPSKVTVTSAPPVLYSVVDTNSLGNPGEDISVAGLTSIQAKASAAPVPLPKVSSTCLLLLGCIGAFGGLRRRAALA